MGIMDKVTALVPRRERRQQQSQVAFDALALRDDLDRWVQRFFDGPDALGFLDVAPAQLPEVRETDDEIVVTVDVPGFDRDDLELMITDAGLIINGERREEARDGGSRGGGTQTRYGRLVDVVALPAQIDASKAEARVERGVLTVRIPKTGTRPGARRIAVSAQ